MKKKIALLMIVALALLTLTSGVNAITWGQRDNGEHPYVGTLLFQRPDGFYSCSGTLLNSRVMLTAGHCTEDSGQTNIRTWVSFEEEIHFPPFETAQDVIRYLDRNWLAVREVIPHPQYDDFRAFPNTYDVGLVILRNPYRLNTYGALPAVGLLDTLVTGQGRGDRQFTAVGYGLQGFVPPFHADDYARYKGTVSLIEVNSYFNGQDQSAKFTNSPGGGNGSGGTCYGDSGGPLFHGNSNVIGAIVSFGITPCIGVDYQFRIDTPTALDFINAHLGG